MATTTAMAPPLLLLQDITLSLGSAPLLDGAEIGVGAGERICLVGQNGSGKSTLLKIAAGLIAPDGGARFVQPGSTIRYLPQEPDLGGFPTTQAYVEAGLGPQDDPYVARAMLDALGLTGAEDPSVLSGGEARRAALARALAPEPDLLLLDEPTNHLDLPAIEWLEAALGRLRSGIVLISHDRRLLETVSRSIVWLDQGRTRRIDRGFAHFEAWRDEVLEQEERDRHKLGRQIAREEDWMRYGVTARRKRNVRRVAELGALRARHREMRGEGGGLRLGAEAADLSGKLVAVAEGVSKARGARLVVRDLDLRVLRGERLCIVGPNGAGKTTLLHLLTGVEAPDSGMVRIGTNLHAVTLDQSRESLDEGKTLAMTLTGGAGDQVQVGDQRRHVIGYMKEFLFRPEQARMPVSQLSGGERGRLMLARALAKPSNLLVLDEPTNDLDLETLDLLQEMLAAYEGTILLVSHDRDFLDRVATATLVSEGDGAWQLYAGGYADMLAQRGGPPAARQAAGQGQAQAAAGGSGAAADAAGKPEARQAGRKLSFKDRHELAGLPAEIARLEAIAAKAEAALADPDLYRRDAKRFEAAGKALQAAREKLAAAEERWLELEGLRESLEG